MKKTPHHTSPCTSRTNGAASVHYTSDIFLLESPSGSLPGTVCLLSLFLGLCPARCTQGAQGILDLVGVGSCTPSSQVGPRWGGRAEGLRPTFVSCLGTGPRPRPRWLEGPYAPQSPMAWPLPVPHHCVFSAVRSAAVTASYLPVPSVLPSCPLPAPCPRPPSPPPPVLQLPPSRLVYSPSPSSLCHHLGQEPRPSWPSHLLSLQLWLQPSIGLGRGFPTGWGARFPRSGRGAHGEQREERLKENLTRDTAWQQDRTLGIRTLKFFLVFCR